MSPFYLKKINIFTFQTQANKMKKIDFTIPKLGESVSEVTLTRYTKQVGDWIDENETIAEVSTDKVDSDIPSSHSGKISKLYFKKGDTIKIGEIYAEIEVNEDESKIESNSDSNKLSI